jgi:threonine/homoserine/homoserine lactone efflux protein
LLGFVLAVIVLVFVPGPNTIIILAHSLGGGRKAGFATLAGVETGTLFHTIAAALGFSALLSASPLAFSIVKWAGVVYLAVIGIKTILEPPPDLANAEALPYPVAYRRAVVTNVLNPKVALFFLAFLPQFVRPEQGHVFLQFITLGLVVSAIGIVNGVMLTMLASSLAGWLRRHSGFRRWQQRVVGAILIGLALLLTFNKH